MMLSQSRVRELLDYNPRTGCFTWRVNLRGHVRQGMIAGTINGNGRRQICIDQVIYCTSRLAFLWMTGKWPKRLAEHKNCNKADDRWRNLRPATNSQNGANSRIHRRKKSGLPKGVDRNGDGYGARIKVNYQTICLGTYKTPKLAHAAYIAAARKHFGDFARAR